MQVVALDDDTWILRESKCVNFEAPFLYLLFGEETVLLHDSGATVSSVAFPLREKVDELIQSRLAARGQPSIKMRITHSHGHADHVLGDGQFADLPPGSIAPTGVTGVSAYFGFRHWPTERGLLNLGGRKLDVLPTPGHTPDHIALFDRRNGLLLTGDAVYAGVLVVNDWRAYRQSIRRLADFCGETGETHPVRFILGAHIEMSRTPGVAYPYGSTFQPDEHPLPLGLDEFCHLAAAVDQAGDHPQRIARASFIVEPAT